MGNKPPQISILLPVYNGEKTLSATLDSLLNQTFSDFELLIGIDGSKDDSKNIAESYEDPRIKIIEHPKNLGLANNLNCLIDRADPRTIYFAMAEQDDVYMPERLEWQVTLMNQKPQIGLVSGIVTFTAVKGELPFPGILVNKKQFPQGKKLFRYLYKNQLKVVNTCMLWRKSVHKHHQLTFRNTYGNFNVDWDFILRFTLVSQIHGLHKVLAKMDRQASNTSVTRNKEEQYKASRKLLKDFKIEFPELVDAKLYKKAMQYHVKLELGQMSKIRIVAYSWFYYFKYGDTYFLKYPHERFKKSKKFKRNE